MTKRAYHDALDDFLDRPISYNPSFKRITGSTVAGIFLSQGWYWSKRHPENDGWFYKSQKEWEEETGLTRSEQETARKHCLRVGVIQEKLKGVPATMHYRVDKEMVYTLIGLQFAETPQTEIAETPQTSSGDGRENAGKLQSDIPSNFNKESETPPMIPSETPRAAGISREWDMLHGLDVQPVDEEAEFLKLAIDSANLIATGKPARYDFALRFIVGVHKIPTESQVKNWRKGIDEWLSFKPHQPKPDDVTSAILEYQGRSLTIATPYSLSNLYAIANPPNGHIPEEKIEDQAWRKQLWRQEVVR